MEEDNNNTEKNTDKEMTAVEEKTNEEQEDVLKKIENTPEDNETLKDNGFNKDSVNSATRDVQKPMTPSSVGEGKPGHPRVKVKADSKELHHDNMKVGFSYASLQFRELW